MVRLIRCLGVRGAPLIGVAAALSLAKFAENGKSEKEFQLALAGRDFRLDEPRIIHFVNGVAIGAFVDALQPMAAGITKACFVFSMIA